MFSLRVEPQKGLHKLYLDAPSNTDR